MTQKPVLKDGKVVNVIEIDGETQVVTKDRHKEMIAAEDADYAQRLGAWRALVQQRHNTIQAATDELSLARATVSALKVTAGNEKDDRKAALALRQILSAEAGIAAIEQGIKVLRAEPLPEKPALVRPKRWFHPEGLEVGPAGGNIGDLWDGEKYTRPEKPQADVAEKVAEPTS